MPIEELFRWPLFWLVVGIVAVAQILLLISAIRMRRLGSEAIAHHDLGSPVELGWTLATAVALFAMLAFVYRALAMT